MNRVNAGTTSPPDADWRQLAFLLLLACIWSSSFMFIKIGVAGIPPATMAAIRLVRADTGCRSACALGEFSASSESWETRCRLL